MTDILQKVLISAGYEGEPTKENVIDCFLDYVSCGAFAGLTLEEARDDISDGDITIDQICRNMLRICK